MIMQLIQGQFSSSDALDLITKMVHTKIKYHESKISGISNEEDIKNREAKIKRLQKDLFEIRKYIESNGNKISIQSTIEIE
jgi:hypothetical protein